MTTATDFETQLDDNPADWTLRAIYADWLEEQGNLRAESMRWMVANDKRPVFDGKWWVIFNANATRDDTAGDMPSPVFEALSSGEPVLLAPTLAPTILCRDYKIRTAAETDLHNALVKAGEITCALIEEVSA